MGQLKQKRKKIEKTKFSSSEKNLEEEEEKGNSQRERTGIHLLFKRKKEKLNKNSQEGQ